MSSSPVFNNKSKVYFGEVLCWLSYLLLKQFYLWDSGLPQLADIFWPLFFMFHILNKKFYFRQLDSTYWLTAFIIYAFVVDVAYYFFFKDTSFIMSILYWIYNYTIFIFVIDMCLRYGKNFLRLTFYGFCLVILLQFFINLIVPNSGEFRNTGSFVNPNQLGYFAILCTSIILFTGDTFKPNKNDLFLILGVLICCLYLINLSGSRASILAVFMLFFVYAIQSKQKIIIFLFGICLILMIIYGFINDNINKRLYGEFAKETYKLSEEASGRGYDRLYNYPEFLLLGAGQGASDRFTKGDITGLEIHSAPATIVFSYGVIGSLFILIFILKVGLLQIKNLIWICPVMFYNITHNGIRQPFLWVFLSIISYSTFLQMRCNESNETK
ncbi:MAG: hypothetical protein LBJ67_18370 [Planctomycetaceae bacterium]|jgi:hypothetical protein|nr:hypothetical protein [Planctomycetaceae bacterium]